MLLVKPSNSAEPPVFVKRLEANTVWKRGTTARLQGSVTGSPLLHTSWFFNNSELYTGGRYELSLKDGVAFLEVQGVELNDSGNYTCEVLNESGCESCSTKVTVKGVWTGLQTPKVPNELRANHNCLFFPFLEPPTLRKALAPVEAVRGSLAVLLFEVSGTAPFQVSWRKNAKRLSADNKFKPILQGSLVSLHIQSFEATDVGEYECIVSNEVGSVVSRAVVQQRGNYNNAEQMNKIIIKTVASQSP